jgi:hypothetical protein
LFPPFATSSSCNFPGTVESSQEAKKEESTKDLTTSGYSSNSQVDNSKQDKPKVEFAQVSQDMSELVYHLNSIQNDISELAGRPISLTKIED